MSLDTAHLFDIEFELGEIHMLGNTPCGQRVIGNVSGGHFVGSRLRGKVLPGGADWGLFRADGTLNADVRACLQTDDGALICVTYGGRWKISPELLIRLGDPEQIASVDPSEYYLRTTMLFETGAEKYGWLNDIVAIGKGRRTVKGIGYSVHEVL